MKENEQELQDRHMSFEEHIARRDEEVVDVVMDMRSELECFRESLGRKPMRWDEGWQHIADIIHSRLETLGENNEGI